MKYLSLIVLSLIVLMGCAKENEPLYWENNPNEFWFSNIDGITTITYGGNSIKEFTKEFKMLSIQTTYVSSKTIGYLYADGDSYIFLAKNGLICKEIEVPSFTTAKVIDNILVLYRNSEEIYNIAL